MYLPHRNCQTLTVTETFPFNWSVSVFEVYLTYFSFSQEFELQTEKPNSTRPVLPLHVWKQNIYECRLRIKLAHSTLSFWFAGTRKWHYSYFIGPRQQQKDWIFVRKESSVCSALSCTLWLVSVWQSKDADCSKSQAKLLGGGHLTLYLFHPSFEWMPSVMLAKYWLPDYVRCYLKLPYSTLTVSGGSRGALLSGTGKRRGC